MDLYDAFAVDEKRLQDGVWRVIESRTNHYPVAENEIGDRTAVLIASMDSPKHRLLLEKKLKPHLMRRGMDLDPVVRERISAEVISETVILDWRNWTVQGQTWPYHKDRVIEIWMNPQWVGLKEVLSNMIGEFDVFKCVQEDTITKNS